MAKYEVADLVFAFNNGEMLKLLIKRAGKLNGANFEAAKKIEDEMTRLKNEKFAQLVQPIYFYCTFKNQAGCKGAIERGKLKFMDKKHRIALLKARSPSDLLWLNRDVSKRSARIGGIVLAIIIICLVLLCGYCFVVEITMQIYILFRMDPPQVTCEVLEETYSYE